MRLPLVGCVNGWRRPGRCAGRRGGDADGGVEVLAQRGRGGESDLARDAVHREVAGLQQVPGPADPLLDEPLPRARADLVPEAPGEGPQAHPRVVREVVQGERQVEVLQCPLPCRRRAGVGRRGDGLLDVLRLTALPPGRYDADAGDEVGHGAAVVGAHQVQADVHAGGGARRGEDVTVVHEEHVRVERHPGEHPPEVVGERPVGGGGAAVQEPGGGEREGRRADGHDARARPDHAERGGDGAELVIRLISYGGITTVSAVASTSGPCSTATEKSESVRTGRPSTVQVSTS